MLAITPGPIYKSRPPISSAVCRRFLKKIVSRNRHLLLAGLDAVRVQVAELQLGVLLLDLLRGLGEGDGRDADDDRREHPGAEEDEADRRRRPP